MSERMQDDFNSVLFGHYNHAKFMREAREGDKIIRNTPSGKEQQLYKVGQSVTSEMSMHRQTGVIIEAYNQNGYWRYTVNFTGKYGKRTGSERQKDLRRA